MKKIKWFILFIGLLQCLTSFSQVPYFLTSNKELKVQAWRIGLSGATLPSGMPSNLGRYKQAGDVQTNSPGDGDRILSNADAFRTSQTNRTADRWNSSALATADGLRVVGNSAVGEPKIGIRLMDCAKVAACYRALGNSFQAELYAKPARNELLWHMRHGMNASGYAQLLDFSRTARWPVDNNKLGDSNPYFSTVEWLGRLFRAYDLVRPSMSAMERDSMNTFFKKAADYAQFNVDSDLNKRFGNGTTDRLSGSQPRFETAASGLAALNSYATVRESNDPKYQMYYGSGNLVGAMGRDYNNRRITVMSLVAMVGADQNDASLMKSALFLYKETFAYSFYPNGFYGDMHRAQLDGNSIATVEKGLNYTYSAIAKLIQIADALARRGVDLWNYTTNRGAYGSEGTNKNLALAIENAQKFLLPAVNGGYNLYATTSASNVGVLSWKIDGVDYNINNGGNSSTIIYDIWLGKANLKLKETIIKSRYLRQAPGSTAYPQYPRGIGSYSVYTGHGQSENGSLLEYAQLEGYVDPYATEPPTGISVSNATTSSLTIGWAINDERATQHIIERSDNGTTGWASVGTTGGSINTFTNNGLTENTNYFYRVASVSPLGTSTYSNVATGATGAGAIIPTSPSGVTYTFLGNGVLNIKWNDNSNNETGFRVYKSLSGSQFLLLTTTAANVTNYIEGGVFQTESYQYRVTAFNGENESNYAEGPLLTFNNSAGVNLAVNSTVNVSSGWNAEGVTDGNIDTLNLRSAYISEALPARLKPALEIDFGQEKTFRYIVDIGAYRLSPRHYRYDKWNGSIWIPIYTSNRTEVVRRVIDLGVNHTASKIRKVFLEGGNSIQVEIQVYASAPPN